MRLGEICNRNVVCADRGTGLQEAAQTMRTRHVGALVVVDQSTKGPLPVGIVTDRDLVVEVFAGDIDSTRLTVEDIMVSPLIFGTEDQDVFDTVEQVQHNGIRRLPVVDRQGCLMGIITADDLLEVLAIQASQLSKVVQRERRQEIQERP